MAATFAGVVEDTSTLFSSDASFGERLLAAGSLATEIVSPVSARDVKAGINAVETGMKRGDDVRDLGRTGDAATGDSVPLLENRFKGSNPPEHPDYPISAGPAPEGTRGWMAVEEGQIDPLTGQVNKPGQFLSDDPITSVDQVRNDLAVRSDWKGNPSYVQEFEVAPGTQIQRSTVGPQTNPDGTLLPGGGRQTQVLENPNEVLRPVGKATPIE